MQEPKPNFCSVTHQGKVRRNNQDYLEINNTGGYATIADGVGGLSHGDIASETATKSCMAYLEDIVSQQQLLTNKQLSNAIKLANEHLITIQQNDDRYSKMGTTLCCFSVNGSEVNYSWVGDSRLYIYKAKSKELLLLTEDHTLDPNKLAAPPSDKLRRKMSSTLTQMVGSLLLLKPGIGTHEIQEKDVLIACTDGLSDMVKEEFIQEHLALLSEVNGDQTKVDSALKACSDKLLDKALDVGGTDNISFIVCSLHSAT